MKNLIIVSLFSLCSVSAKTFNKRIFEKTINEMKLKSLHELNEDEIYKSALKGVLSYLETRNKNIELQNSENANVLITPTRSKEMEKEMEGKISGIGVGIQYDKNKGQVYPILIDIREKGGAAEAGLKIGDQILKIDGKSVNDFKSFSDIVYKIRGKSGSKVKLSVLRDGEVLKKRVYRKKIKWDAVEVAEKTKEYLSLKVNFFNKKTTEAISNELVKAKTSGKRKVIIDLRDNTGGLFQEGLKAIYLFSAKNKTVLKAKYGREEMKSYLAPAEGIGKGFKVVVLISKKTKSMGEAFAASLREAVGATIIGEKSFGKGTVETVLDVGNTHSVKFSIGRLFTADEKTWDQVGVSPDIVVSTSKSKKDSSLDLAKVLMAKM